MKIRPPDHPNWVARSLAAVLGAVLLMLVTVQTAAAAPLVRDGSYGLAPPALSWFDVQDSRGISVWKYEISLDRGSSFPSYDPGKFLWSSVVDVVWSLYRGLVVIALWFLDWVLGLSWVHFLAAPLLAIGDALQSIIGRLGVVPTFLTVAAFMAGLWIIRGKVTTAVWEVGVACVIAVLGAGVFAHPVAMVAGPDGYIVQANQLGQEISAGLATGELAGDTPEQLHKAQTALLVDTFLRQPTQLINFGRVLDGTKCEGAYNKALKAGPYGTDSDLRDAVGDCDDALGEYAANPSPSMAFGSVIFIPAAFVVLLIALVMAGSVLSAAAWAMFQSLKAIVTLVTGLLPGGGRGALMRTMAEVVVALAGIVFTSVFLSGFLLVIQQLFAGSSGDPIGKTFAVVDVALVVGLIVYWRQRKQLAATSERLAQWMSQRPGASPTSLPARAAGSPFGGAASRAAALGVGFMHARARMLDARKPPPLPANTNVTIFARGSGGAGPGGPGAGAPPFMRADPRRPAGGRSPGGRGGGGQLPGSPDRPLLPPGPSGPPGPPEGGPRGGGRVRPGRKLTGALARAGTTAALAYATGGASTAVTGTAKAVRAARTARRVALSARFAAAKAAPRDPTRQTPPPVPASGPGAGQVVPGQVVSPRPASSDPARSATHAHGTRRAPTPPPETTSSAPARSSPAGEDPEAAARLRARLAARTRRRSAGRG